jgi:hypothetical protein
LSPAASASIRARSPAPIPCHRGALDAAARSALAVPDRVVVLDVLDVLATVA